MESYRPSNSTNYDYILGQKLSVNIEWPWEKRQNIPLQVFSYNFSNGRPPTGNLADTQVLLNNAWWAEHYRRSTSIHYGYLLDQKLSVYMI